MLCRHFKYTPAQVAEMSNRQWQFLIDGWNAEQKKAQKDADEAARKAKSKKR